MVLAIISACLAVIMFLISVYSFGAIATSVFDHPHSYTVSYTEYLVAASVEEW